ncbi:uncharacterized protein PAC_00900 [Phialocephala subalpina]|uniref:DUF6594 domain-containing protein n=1 Tax=Phialocephala subalpina TaxID=576137 RepID=A0A1L7WE17_9HELO|nr:uncharacterized protein PAC_00900 [Phialocephala subalpina]
MSDKIEVEEQIPACGSCTDHTAIAIPAEDDSIPDSQTSPDVWPVIAGSPEWRRAILKIYGRDKTEEGLRELTDQETEDKLMNLAYAKILRNDPLFRHFDYLNYVNLTLVQDELVGLLKQRALLKSYNNALLAYHQVCNLSERLEDLVESITAAAVNGRRIPNIALKRIYNSKMSEKDASCELDRDREKQRNLLQEEFFPEDGVSDTVDYLARLITSLIGCILLIALMVALSFIHEKKCRLLIVLLFLVVFALSCSLAAFKLTVQELLEPTAAYAAVLVVFISSTPTL